MRREPGPDLDEVIADLPEVRAAGFSLIKIQGHWAHDEPEPGVLAVEETERLISAAASADLGVYLGLTMEQAPSWLWRRHPDAHHVDAQGRAHNDPTPYTLPADGKPGPCRHHPQARAAAESFIHRYVARMAPHDNIWVWNTWQEIGFWHHDAGELGFCYCHHTLTAFRRWLRGRYGSVGRLNTVWRARFGRWDEVQPPRRYTASPAFLDWREFMDDVAVSETLARRRQVVRTADPARRPVFGHLGDIDLGSTKAWRYAATGDLFGVSVYPAWHPFRSWDDVAAARTPDADDTLLYELWDRVLMQFDLLRGATAPDRPAWGAEFQGGPINDFLHLGRVPDAADIRRWVLGALAAGAQGITFWNLRSEGFWQEAGGFGLLDRAGSGTPRFAEAGRLARALSRHPALFARGTGESAPVAMLLSERAHHFAQGTGTQARTYLEGSLRGHYLRLARLGVPVDFVDADSGPDLSGYRVVIAAAPLLVTAATAAAMRTYVEGGGTLLVEAPSGWVDDHGFTPAGATVEDGERLFGVRTATVRVVDEPGDRRWTPAPRGWGEFHPPAVAVGTGAYDGESVALCGLVQELRPLSASAVLTVGETVVASRNAFGRGVAILLGTLVGLTGTAYRHPPTDRFVERILREAGVPVTTVPGVQVRERSFGSERATFLVNLRPDPVDVRVRVPGAMRCADLLDLPSEQTGESVRLTVPGLDVRCLVWEVAPGAAGPARLTPTEGNENETSVK
ncbi:beta-galactosidase [Micromonospora sp. NPDC051300]|uniref:beta-galactosidase n=1 Tax=Micromonospora sp. NPDC051300 TaxID=3364286 RepID=UPI00379625FA